MLRQRGEPSSPAIRALALRRVAGMYLLACAVGVTAYFVPAFRGYHHAKSLVLAVTFAALAAAHWAWSVSVERRAR